MIWGESQLSSWLSLFITIRNRKTLISKKNGVVSEVKRQLDVVITLVTEVKR